MRRVLPDPDVLQMHLQSVVIRVQSTINKYIQAFTMSKYLLDFIAIAHVEIVK
jgi:hypothetical protein